MRLVLATIILGLTVTTAAAQASRDQIPSVVELRALVEIGLDDADILVVIEHRGWPRAHRIAWFIETPKMKFSPRPRAVRQYVSVSGVLEEVFSRMPPGWPKSFRSWRAARRVNRQMRKKRLGRGAGEDV